MIGADRITLEAARELDEAIRAGLPAKPVILRAHGRFAENAAELWHLACRATPTNLADPLGFKRQALREQIDVVAPTNAFFFGVSPPGFDDRCQDFVRASFEHRVVELERGWR